MIIPAIVFVSSMLLTAHSTTPIPYSNSQQPDVAEASSKRMVTPEDYKLWHLLIPDNISDDGQWVSYRFRYDLDSDKDMLFVKNLTNESLFKIPGGLKGTFSADSTRYVHLVSDGSLGIINLDTGDKISVENAAAYKLSSDGVYLAIHVKEPTNENKVCCELLLMELNEGHTSSMAGVAEYDFNALSSHLAYITHRDGDNSLEIFNIDSHSTTTVARDEKSSFSQLTWHKEGESLAFFQEVQDNRNGDATHIVHHYNVAGIENPARLLSFDHREAADFPPGMQVLNSRLIISDDQQTIFFNTQASVPRDDSNQQSMDPGAGSDVQVWHTRDREIYTDKRRRPVTPKLSAWWPNQNKFLQIQSDNAGRTILNGDQKYALTLHTQPYEHTFGGPPENPYLQETDVYIVDIETGENKLLIERFLDGMQRILASPDGRYISYFKDSNWWVYDIKRDTHKNVTADLDVPFYRVGHDMPEAPGPYRGIPGWTKDDLELILYDQYDIWLVSPDGTSHTKLTDGRDKHIVYRIHDPFNHPSYDANSFDLSEGLVLSAYGEKTKESGYYLWNPHSSGEMLIFDEMHISHLRKAKDAKVYIYLKERFDLPRMLSWSTEQPNSEIDIVESNPHHRDFHWGRSELIDYVNADGMSLQGALFYPADYQPGTKYPMIVNIYEKKSQRVHRYENPGSILGGFNPVTYTNDGYFVLYPDIIYEIDDPGGSALKSVVAAVEQILDTGMIDPNRVGIEGESFGGYETLFIVTQTDLFAAAAAGTAFANLISWYLSMGGNLGIPTMWRFEHQQQRFSGPFYEHFDAYVRNSPVHNAEGITTPVLSWFGDQDGQVDWHQGIEMYNLMRRMGKEYILLVYPGERHDVGLNNEENRTDLARRKKEWFDHYLKGAEPAKWIVGEKESP